jgi:hypothetical protein
MVIALREYYGSEVSRAGTRRFQDIGRLFADRCHRLIFNAGMLTFVGG